MLLHFVVVLFVIVISCGTASYRVSTRNVSEEELQRSEEELDQ